MSQAENLEVMRQFAKATAEGRPDAVIPLLGETVEIDDYYNDHAQAREAAGLTE